MAKKPSEGPIPDLTAFEERALKEMSRLFGAEEDAYLQQVQNAKVLDRENTFVGFYTRVDIDRSACGPVNFGENPLNCWFEVDGVDGGVGILLWVEDDYLDTIEGFTANDDGLGGQNLADLKYVAYSGPSTKFY